MRPGSVHPLSLSSTVHAALTSLRADDFSAARAPAPAWPDSEATHHRAHRSAGVRGLSAPHCAEELCCTRGVPSGE